MSILVHLELILVHAQIGQLQLISTNWFYIFLHVSWCLPKVKELALAWLIGRWSDYLDRRLTCIIDMFSKKYWAVHFSLFLCPFCTLKGYSDLPLYLSFFFLSFFLFFFPQLGGKGRRMQRKCISWEIMFQNTISQSLCAPAHCLLKVYVWS